MYSVGIHPGITVDGKYIDIDKSIYDNNKFDTEERANDYAKSVVVVVPTAEATVYLESFCECCGDMDLDRFEGRKHQESWDRYHAARRAKEDAA